MVSVNGVLGYLLLSYCPIQALLFRYDLIIKNFVRERFIAVVAKKPNE
jgi:hypothetical protein